MTLHLLVQAQVDLSFHHSHEDELLKVIPHKESKKTVRGFGNHLARVSMENCRLREQNEELNRSLRALQEKVKALELENKQLKNQVPNLHVK